MKVCYIDESGDTGILPSAASSIQPTLAICGLIVDVSGLGEMTSRLIATKQRFFPGRSDEATTWHGWMPVEIKGADVRRLAATGRRTNHRHAMGFLTETLAICEDLEARLTGRIWVKGVGRPINGTSIYTASIQAICADFQNYLESSGDLGVVIADSRVKHLNTQVAHSIFTQKFRAAGDPYDRIVELPSFSHSDNHAGLQLCDIVCSAIVTPIAINTYCEGHLDNLHVRPGYSRIRTAFAERCNTLQYRYRNPDGRRRGGLTVADGLAGRSGSLMFK